MKTLSQHISQVKTLHSLNEFIEEKLIINKNFKAADYFIYKLEKEDYIKIISSNSRENFVNLKNNIYLNGEHVEIDRDGYTKKLYGPGKYIVEIENINNMTDCYFLFENCRYLVHVPYFDTSKVENMYKMFEQCTELVDVPLFDTSKVINMSCMFSFCKKLKTVPLFDTSKVSNMSDMFYKCKNLSDKTKNEWSKIYDFNKCDKI